MTSDFCDVKQEIKRVIQDPQLTFHQRKHRLAQLSENLLAYVPISQKARTAMQDGIICDLFEGHAPYRPRYILPDYKRALNQGCEFLELGPPADLDEAINFLTIFYTYVPSITGFPVYLGNLDGLLLPYAQDVTEHELYQKLKLFLRSVDRLLPDGFVHANLGPEDNRVARGVFALERELKHAVPNLTLKVDPNVTSDDFLKEGIRTVFQVGKPHFANHEMMQQDFGEAYGVASCYNSLREGGGAHTLVRLNLKKVIEEHLRRYGKDKDAFLSETLPEYVHLTLEVIHARAKYLVETSGFYDHSFLVEEGFIHKENFGSMFGIFGLSECVNLLLGQEAGSQVYYGHDLEANQLSYEITDTVARIISDNPTVDGDGNEYPVMFHAQSGIDLDVDTTPGTRLPPGEEPDLMTHIQAVAPHHKKFISGISDIFHFDSTVKANPDAIVDIIKGAFREGMREFTFNLADGEFVRITGYLVRRSDLEKYRKNQSTRYSTTPLGEGAIQTQGVLERKRRLIDCDRTRASD